MLSQDSISLILPMYNELEYLRKTVEIAKSVLQDITCDFEIIIVDDASTDDSGQIADALSKSDSRIKVIHHTKNRKLGGALKTGFSRAKNDIVVYTDIDLPFDLAKLKDAVPLISEFDIVKGYRINSRESLLRTVYSKGYNFLINCLFNLKIKDINFAMKIFKRKILDDLSLKSEGSFINAEFLIKAKKLGYSIKEIEAEYSLRTYGISRLSAPIVILKILYEMIRFYPELKFFSRKKIIYAKIKKFYKRIKLRAKIYNLIRFKTCPFDLINKFVPKYDSVVDLGCGTGLFLNLLRLSFNKCALLGFDNDKRKIKIARESLNGNKNINFKIENIASNEFSLPKAKCITLIDVLCYFNTGLKKQILKKCFAALDRDGILLVKDLNKSLNLKFLYVFLQEIIAVKIFHITKTKELCFEHSKNYSYLLEEAGFIITEVIDLSKGYLYPHILYVGKKQ